MAGAGWGGHVSLSVRPEYMTLPSLARGASCVNVPRMRNRDTRAATAARVRNSEEKLAEKLRSRGWAVIPPEEVPCLSRQHQAEALAAYCTHR